MKRKTKSSMTKFVTTNVVGTKDPLLQIVMGLWDKKALTFIETSMVQNTGVAVRGFTGAVNNSQGDNNLYKWPDDYELYTLGTYNPRTGQLFPDEKRLIATGENVKVR